MKIGQKLQNARKNRQLTQEEVSSEILVSRQTISNWENEKSYPDIINIIKLSNIYEISLDDLLKGDENIMNHLAESTNLVKSNAKLIIFSIINILIFIVLIVFNTIFQNDQYLLFVILTLASLSVGLLFYQIIRRF